MEPNPALLIFAVLYLGYWALVIPVIAFVLHRDLETLAGVIHHKPSYLAVQQEEEGASEPAIGFRTT